MNELTIQTELHSKDKGGSLEYETVKAEDMWGSRGGYKAFRSMGDLFLDRVVCIKGNRRRGSG